MSAAAKPFAASSKRGSPYQPKGRQIEDQAAAEIRDLLADRPCRRDLLIEHLHLIQDRFGGLSSAHLTAVAVEMRLSMAEVYEVATFYHHFDILADGAEPARVTVRVCDGITCEMAGGRKLLRDLAAKYVSDDVRVVAAPCIGACDGAPAAAVGQNRLGSATPAAVIDAIDAAAVETAIPTYEDLGAYRESGGYGIWERCRSGERDRERVIATIDSSGLRGLGGAGFPSARKWRFLEGKPKPRLLAVNADEGEPGTFKDRHCLETYPHRVLEGALIAAWAVEAEAIYIYLRDEYPHIHEILLREIERLQDDEVTDGIAIHLRRGAGAYICGEESAMLESIEGKRGLPRNRPPFPAERGLFGRPTLINNVETLFWVRDILENGAFWFEEMGRPHLFSVSGRVKEPGVCLARAGVTANQLIEECGGMADGHTFKAFLPGGASGGLLPADKGDVPLDFGTLDEFGCFIGSSAVVIFSEADDVAAICRNLIKFFEDESCGQCTPCRVGCEKMSALIAEKAWDAPLIEELSQAMRDASICGLGQAAPNPVLSTLRFFGDDVT